MIEKNTIWAIVLSTIVIIGAYFVLPLVMNKNAPIPETPAAEQVAEETANKNVSNEIVAVENNSEEITESTYAEEEVEEVKSVEEFITYKNDLVEVIFTTKGGDIVSYKLLKHNDTDSNDFVQLSDNINDKNRTCAIALGSSEKEIINEIFNFKKDEKNPNVFFFTKDFKVNGKKVSLGKRYTFEPEEYMFKLEVLVHSDSGLDINGAAYTLRTSPQIGPYFDAKQNRYENRQFIAFDGKKSKKNILADGQFKKYEKDFVWGGIAGKYFEEIVIPESLGILNNPYYSSSIEVKKKDKDYANAQAMFERKSFTDKDVKDSYFMYFGPRNEKDVKIYNNSDTNKWNLSGIKLSESLQTSGWLSWLENILKWCLEKLHLLISNWGLCIIILTLILKLLLFPLSKKQSMGTLKMQQLQPQIKIVQEKYKDDKQRQQIELQKIYKEANYNPASGCLPLIFQFLIIFAMYNLFNNYFEFRGASFIPGWIPDLTAGDSVYTFEGNGIWLLGNHIRILPVVYVASQILFSIITQTTNATANGMSMKIMTYGMPIFFFFLFYNAPSGLLIYWITSNVFQMIQQFIINAMMKSKKAEMENKVPAKKTGKSTKK